MMKTEWNQNNIHVQNIDAYLQDSNTLKLQKMGNTWKFAHLHSLIRAFIVS